MNLRKALFTLQDLLKGGKVKNQLEEIEKCFRIKNFQELKKYNQQKLDVLLNEVVLNTEFYKPYRNYKSLQDFPIINKSIIKTNFEAINISVPKKRRVLVKTSGSTGTPFKIYQCSEKKVRNTADTIYFAKTAGFELGHELLYLRYWAAYYKKPKWLAVAQNVRQLDVADLSDKTLDKLIKRITSQKGKKGWLGYPSGYEKIIKYLEKTDSAPLDCNVQSIIAMSEPLPDFIKEKMTYYFNCPTVSRYSNVENGIIAQQMPYENTFTINWASYYVELLDLEEDKPAEKGELGRIVITDLYNRATPMIRYDTGDIGVLEFPTNDLPKFKRIEGRITDILTNTQGDSVNPFILFNSLGDYPELNQVQLIQKDSTYTFKINTEEHPFKREKEFMNKFTPFLGKGADVRIDYVKEIPNLNSGKRKMIINLTETGPKA